MRFYVILVIAVLAIILVDLIPIQTLWVKAPVFLIGAFFFVKNGLKKIPADPPSKGVLMIFGKRQEAVLNEGWHFFPLYPFFSSFLLVRVSKITSTFGPQKLRTPDGAMISTSEAIIWKPGIEGKPKSYINYLNSGGESGVKAILLERIEDRVKTWGTSNQEGPAKWEEALGLRDDAHVVLAKALLGDALPSIPEDFQDIPTSTWMRFLNKPKSPPTAYDMRPENGRNGIPWASIDDQGRWNWDGLQAIFDGYTDIQRSDLQTSIKDRKTEINKLRSANLKVEDEGLGITILGFSVDEIGVEGKVAQAAEEAEKERKQQNADKVGIQNVSDRAKELRKQHRGLSVEKAFEIVQTERGKVGKTIIAVDGAQTAIGHDLLGVGALIKEVRTVFKGGSSQSEGDESEGKQKKEKGGKKVSDLSEEEKEALFGEATKKS